MGDLKKKIKEIIEKIEEIIKVDELKRKLIANLQEYLRERQDFIASIPTMDPIWSAPMDIIGDIFEPILGNLNNKCPQLFLLFDNIARSENIRAGAVQFNIKFFTSKGNIRYESKFEISGGNISYKFEEVNGNEEVDKDYKAAIYLGTSGCQAFYSIIENILRNTTRHSNKDILLKVVKYSESILKKQSPQNDCQPLKITIEFHIDDDKENKYKDDYILVKIYDNMGGWKKLNDGIWVVKEKEGSNDSLKLVVLEENVKEEDAKQKLKNYIKINDASLALEKKEEEINKELNEKIFNRRFNPECPEGRIIDETGKIIEGNWGLKEMRICASFLRGFKIENYEKVIQDEPSVITPYIQPDKNNENTGSLGYKFYIPKAKDLLIISKDIAKENDIKKKVDTLKSQGIYIENDINKITELQNKGKFTHEFVVIDIDEENNIDFIEKHYLELPYKLFYLTNNPQNFPERIKNIDEKWEKKIIKKDEFEKWFSPNGYFTINEEKFEVNDNKPNSLKSYERVILEIKKKWIECLSCIQNFNFPKVGFFPFTLSIKNWNSNNLIFALVPKNGIKSFTVDNNILLLHKFDRYDEVFSQNPLCVIPFAHAIPSQTRSIKMKFQNSMGKIKGDILKSYFDIVEAGITNIIVIDERIYKDTENKKVYDKEITYAKSYFYQNVLIFNLEKRNNKFILKSFQLNDKEKEIEVKNIINYLPEKFKRKIHFLIIHQTIISPKIGGLNEFEKFKEELRDDLKPWFIVVTSGRGHPPEKDMPLSAKFYDFSNLKYCIDNQNKFLLVKTLFDLKEEKLK